jgi:glutamine synthetase adenylyltransferase
MHNKGVATLPADEENQRLLARRMGTESLASFGDEYRGARETIHDIYVRRFST